MNVTASGLDRPKRWDSAFAEDMTDADVQRLLSRAPFSAMNPDNFPRAAPLADVLKNDARIRRYAKGEIIVREGDYGTSAFLVLEGTARVVLSPGLPPSAMGRREPARRGIFRAIAQLWSNSREDEVTRRGKERGLLGRPARVNKDDVHVVLQDIPRVLDRHRTVTIGPGDFFGEIAALSRMPRTASIFADEENTELLEIRWQGLRDLMRNDPTLRQHIDRIYRQRALASYLAEIPFMRHLSEEAKKKVMDATQLETYGEYDWSGEYKKLLQSGTSAAKEQVIAAEGDYPNSVIMIRAGFARMTKRYGSGHRTLNYLGSGRLFGFDELAHNWQNPEKPVALQHTLRVIGYTHVLVIPAAIIEEVVLPALEPSELPPRLPQDAGSETPFGTHSPFDGTHSPFARAGGSKATARSKQDSRAEVEAPISSDLMEFLTQNRFFNGTQTMVIDMDRCTRCDDCVRACAATHDNNPRFLRHGPIHDHIMVAQSCMHCADPVCMIGCPTGAIHRDAFEGEVVINPATCIGCGVCANNCPYQAIRMVETRDESGQILVASDARPIVRATKCDLCLDQYGGPACVRACPHDALGRVDLNTLDDLVSWLRR